MTEKEKHGGTTNAVLWSCWRGNPRPGTRRMGLWDGRTFSQSGISNHEQMFWATSLLKVMLCKQATCTKICLRCKNHTPAAMCWGTSYSLALGIGSCVLSLKVLSLFPGLGPLWLQADHRFLSRVSLDLRSIEDV